MLYSELCRTRGIKRLFTVVLLLLLGPPKVGQAQPITWSDAVREATTHAPNVSAARARVEEFHHGEDVARMIPNPTLTVASYLETTRLYAAIAVPLPIFGQLGLAGEAAQARTDEAQAQLRVVQLEAGLAALTSWIDVWLAHATLRAVEANTARLLRLEVAIRALTDAEVRPRMDMLGIHAEVANARAEQDAATHALVGAQLALAGRLGLPVEARPDVIGAPPDEPPPTLATVFDQARAHPALAVIRARATAAARDARTEERLRIPTPTLQVAGYFFRASNPPNDLYVGLGFELPIFNRRGPLIDRARAREVTAVVDGEALSRQLHADAGVAWEQFAAARARAQAQITEVLPTVTEAAELSLEAYNAGRLDLAGLLAAEQRRQLAQLRADQSVADRARALVGLQRAMGGVR